MLEVQYFLLKMLAVLRLELYAGFSEQLEHFPQVEQVVLELSANHDHVVQVLET
jgi:hypothetical protein